MERASSAFSASASLARPSANPNHPNPTLSKLATGKLELEVKEAEKLPEKKEKQGARGTKLQPGTEAKLEWASR